MVGEWYAISEKPTTVLHCLFTYNNWSVDQNKIQIGRLKLINSISIPLCSLFSYIIVRFSYVYTVCTSEKLKKRTIVYFNFNHRCICIRNKKHYFLQKHLSKTKTEAIMFDRINLLSDSWFSSAISSAFNTIRTKYLMNLIKRSICA